MPGISLRAPTLYSDTPAGATSDRPGSIINAGSASLWFAQAFTTDLQITSTYCSTRAGAWATSCRTPHPPPGLTIWRHLGLYGYRRDFLEQFVAWPPGLLEQSEQLEQLRALENGTRIRVLLTDDHSLGLDTPAQVPELEALLAADSARPPSPTSTNPGNP